MNNGQQKQEAEEALHNYDDATVEAIETLFHMLREGRPADEIEVFLNEHLFLPTLCDTLGRLMQRALNHACMWRNSKETLQILFDHCERDFVVNTSNPSLLRTAVQFGASLDVVQFLLLKEAYSQPAIRSAPHLHNTILHLACKSRHALPEVIDFLIHEFPESVSRLNDLEETPLQLYCLDGPFRPSLDIIRLLAQQFPQAITRPVDQQQQQQYRETLIQHLCRTKKRIHAIPVLLEALQLCHSSSSSCSTSTTSVGAPPGLLLDKDGNTLLHLLTFGGGNQQQQKRNNTSDHSETLIRILDCLPPTTTLVLNKRGQLAWDHGEEDEQEEVCGYIPGNGAVSIHRTKPRIGGSSGEQVTPGPLRLIQMIARRQQQEQQQDYHPQEQQRQRQPSLVQEQQPQHDHCNASNNKTSAVARATQEAAHALMELAFMDGKGSDLCSCSSGQEQQSPLFFSSSPILVALPPSVRQHIQGAVFPTSQRPSVAFVPPPSDNDNDCADQSSFLTRDMCHHLVHHDEIQTLLRSQQGSSSSSQSSFPELLQGLVRMNRAGRRTALLHEPGNKLVGMTVLQAAMATSSSSSSLDCIYIHLRENPLLCYQQQQ